MQTHTLIERGILSLIIITLMGVGVTFVAQANEEIVVEQAPVTEEIVVEQAPVTEEAPIITISNYQPDQEVASKSNTVPSEAITDFIKSILG